MSHDISPRLGLPFLVSGQSQKEITHNEALQALDALVQPVAQSADLSTPPVSPLAGQCWVVAAGASGLWSGREGQMAQWTGGGWRYTIPAEGWRCHVIDRNVTIRHDGVDWLEESAREDGLYISGMRVVTAQQSSIDNPAGGAVADSEARATIGAILTVLRSHGLIAT